MWALAAASAAVATHETLFAGYVRSRKAPLEVYPFHYLRLCIQTPVGESARNAPHKCKIPLTNVPSSVATPPRDWFTPEVSNSMRVFSVSAAKAPRIGSQVG